MDKEEFQKLKDQIWATRISRINAEKRLMQKEKFFQGINIYYSCVTIIFSILSLFLHDDILGMMTIFMTISLLVVILYLNSQKYLEHAREYRKNYTEIHKLELSLKHVDEHNEEEIKQIEQTYCKLLDSNINHSTFDYYQTIYGSSRDYKEKRWEGIRAKYYWGIFWRACMALIIIILPFLLCLLWRCLVAGS